MARFIYMHLGDDIPKRIEKEYNKMLRREKYLEERDAEFMAQSTDYDAVSPKRWADSQAVRLFFSCSPQQANLWGDLQDRVSLQELCHSRLTAP